MEAARPSTFSVLSMAAGVADSKYFFACNTAPTATDHAMASSNPCEKHSKMYSRDSQRIVRALGGS
jgi:hypothetical protein